MLREDDWFDAPIAHRARRAWRITLVCYLVPVTIATHWPRLAVVGSGTVDKFIHFVGFGALAWVFLNAALFRRPILNLALGAFWVYLDEYTQSFKIFGRTFSGNDMAAGWFGCLVAGLVWGAIRMRAPRATAERLDDLTAERLLFASGREWLLAAATTLALGGLVAGLMLSNDPSDAPLVGTLVYPVGLGGLAAAVVATVHGYLRAHARLGRGGADAAGAGGAAIGLRDLTALVWPVLAGAVLLIPAAGCVLLCEWLLFGPAPSEANAVDFDGFVVLRPTFIVMLACAGAVATASIVARRDRARRGFGAQRQRP